MQSDRLPAKSLFKPLLLFIGLSLIFTWPLPLKAVRHVVDSAGDNLHFAWMIGWFEEALLERGINPYFVPILNYPEGWELARSEIPLALVLMALPLSVLSNPLLGYNFAVLLSFILTGLTTYVWMRHLRASRLASLFAGIAFAFAPFRIAHFRAGHLNILSTMWFPLFFMGFLDFLRGKTVSVKMGLVAGVSLGLISLSSQYYFYVTCLVSLVLAAGFIGFRLLVSQPSYDLGRGSLAALLAALPLSLAGVIPYLRLTAEGELPERSVFAVSGGSASLSDFILPATDHFLWGSWVSQNFSRDSWIEGSLYLGVVCLALATLAVLTKARSGNEDRQLVLLLLALAAVGGVIALGTHLHWNEGLVQVSTPRAIQAALGREQVSVRLPGFYFFRFVPFFDRMRTFKRAAALVLLPVSVLGGLGLDVLHKRLHVARRETASLIVLALLLLEIYPGPFRQWERVEPRPVDVWLKEHSGGGAVVVFPFHLQEDQRQVYATLHHEKPFVGGFFSAFPPRQYRNLRGTVEQFPSIESTNSLRQLGVSHVMIDVGQPEGTEILERQLAMDNELVLVGEFDSIWLFHLRSAP